MNEESKTNTFMDDSTIIIELLSQEIELIRNLRTRFRFGEVTIIMRDGVPFRLKRITEFADLDKASQ